MKLSTEWFLRLRYVTICVLDETSFRACSSSLHNLFIHYYEIRDRLENELRLMLIKFIRCCKCKESKVIWIVKNKKKEHSPIQFLCIKQDVTGKDFYSLCFIERSLHINVVQ